MVTQKNIRNFLAQSPIAIAGVSRNNKKFGYKVYQEFLTKGYNVVPVNPNADNIDGRQCFRSIDNLPPEVKALYIVTPPTATNELVRQALARNINHIWIQRKSETTEAIDTAVEKKVNLVHKTCILMYIDPKGFPHRAHRFFQKLFGVIPPDAT